MCQTTSFISFASPVPFIDARLMSIVQPRPEMHQSEKGCLITCWSILWFSADVTPPNFLLSWRRFPFTFELLIPSHNHRSGVQINPLHLCLEILTILSSQTIRPSSPKSLDQGIMISRSLKNSRQPQHALSHVRSASQPKYQTPMNSHYNPRFH